MTIGLSKLITLIKSSGLKTISASIKNKWVQSVFKNYATNLFLALVTKLSLTHIIPIAIPFLASKSLVDIIDDIVSKCILCQN